VSYIKGNTAEPVGKCKAYTGMYRASLPESYNKYRKDSKKPKKKSEKAGNDRPKDWAFVSLKDNGGYDYDIPDIKIHCPPARVEAPHKPLYEGKSIDNIEGFLSKCVSIYDK